MNYQEFVKTYTTIPNQFLDEFLVFFDLNADEDKPTINLDAIAKWQERKKEPTM